APAGLGRERRVGRQPALGHRRSQRLPPLGRPRRHRLIQPALVGVGSTERVIWHRSPNNGFNRYIAANIDIIVGAQYYALKSSISPVESLISARAIPQLS